MEKTRTIWYWLLRALPFVVMLIALLGIYVALTIRGAQVIQAFLCLCGLFFLYIGYSLNKQLATSL